MPEACEALPRQEEWNFEELLKSTKLAEVRFCYRYEFGREALDYSWLAAHSKLSLEEVAVLFEHPNVPTENFLFYRHYFSVLERGVWLKAPYFDLPGDFRAMVAEWEKTV